MKFFLLVVFAIMLVVGNVGSALAGIQSSHLEVFSQLSKNDSLINDAKIEWFLLKPFY